MSLIIIIVATILVYNMAKSSSGKKVTNQIKETQSETYTINPTRMHDNERMTQDEMDRRKAEIKQRLQHNQDPHYLPKQPLKPTEKVIETYHDAMDTCETDGCYDEAPKSAPKKTKKQKRNDPHYMPSAANIPSAAKIDRMQTKVDDCDIPGCDVDNSGQRKSLRPRQAYPLLYQLTLADAILHRGGRQRMIR